MTTLIAPDPRRRAGRGSGASQLRLPQLHRRLTPPLGGPTAAPPRARRRNGGPPRAAIA